MKLTAGMIGAAILCAVALVARWESATARDVSLGMLGPLVAAVVEWILVRSTHIKTPQKVVTVLVGLFVAKMAFFGVYIAMLLRLDMVRPVPFVISFSGAFLTVLVVEAIALRRLTTPALGMSLPRQT